ncbi:MAG TPA: HAD-IIIA family hydrolase [Longimicrobiales bacterium]|nr:HAD-IIIA family hydrolase [Longimicrobiales bacterium]
MSLVPQGGPVPVELARRIKLVVLDVDGVLTDGGVYVGLRSGEEFKRFDIQDGLGMKLLEKAGLKVLIVSGRHSEATQFRADELGIECYQDAGAQKLPSIMKVMARLDIAWDEVSMLGDDIPDVAVLRRVGLKAAVANAVPLVAAMADWRTVREGGHGAVREFCDALLVARGDFERVVEAYVAERSLP